MGKGACCLTLTPDTERWRERSDSAKLPSDHHKCAVVCISPSLTQRILLQKRDREKTGEMAWWLDAFCSTEDPS